MTKKISNIQAQKIIVIARTAWQGDGERLFMLYLVID